MGFGTKLLLLRHRTDFRALLIVASADFQSQSLNSTSSRRPPLNPGPDRPLGYKPRALWACFSKTLNQL